MVNQRSRRAPAGATAAAATAAAKSGASGKALPSYSWRDVAKHNTERDAWVSFDGRVYDVTEWIGRHPGGRETLLVAAGRDVTQLFRTYHSESAEQLLPKMCVGTLSDHELPQFPAPTPLHRELKARTLAVLRAAGCDPKNSAWVWLRYALIFGTVLACSYLQSAWWARGGFALGVALAAVQGFASALACLMPVHDASHYSITHSPLVWKVVQHTHDFFNGASSLVWTYQHVLGHHLYTNVDGADPDVWTEAENDFRRIKPYQAWYARYAYQYVYAPIAYGLLAWKSRVQDFYILFVAKANGPIRVNPLAADQLALFVAGKATWFTYRIVAPVLVGGVPLWAALAYLAINDMVTSYWLALTFQANHVVDGVVWPVPDAHNRIAMDWAEMQVRTTQDYAHTSRSWTLLTGALNYQVVHHVLPGTCQIHYPRIADTFKRTCAEHNVPFLHLDGGIEAIGSHIEYLRKMGEQPKAHAS